MKKVMTMMLAILLTGAASFAQEKSTTTVKTTHRVTAAKKYTCPMHPEVARSKPGQCPKCGMALVAMKKKTVKTDKKMGDMKM